VGAGGSDTGVRAVVKSSPGFHCDRTELRAIDHNEAVFRDRPITFTRSEARLNEPETPHASARA